MCACMRTYGNLWELMGTYGNLWELMGTYGNLWELMGTSCVGTYGNLWELMFVDYKYALNLKAVARKSPDGHTTNVLLLTDFFHMELIKNLR